MNKPNTIRRLAVVASIALATPMIVSSQDQQAGSETRPTSRGGYDAGRFAEQADELGLPPDEAAALQKRVDDALAKNGGMQISLNQVLSSDGSTTTTIPLGGENRNRGAVDDLELLQPPAQAGSNSSARHAGSPEPQGYIHEEDLGGRIIGSIASTRFDGGWVLFVWNFTVEDIERDGYCVYGKVTYDKPFAPDLSSEMNDRACGNGTNPVDWDGSWIDLALRGAKVSICQDIPRSGDRCEQVHYEPA
jgi:hypothetical protein